MNMLRLEAGSHQAGWLSVHTILYRDVAAATMAATGERLRDRPTVVLTASNESMYIAPVNPGMAREVLQLLQRNIDSGAR